MMDTTLTLSWFSWWYDSDWIIRGVFVVLVLASIISWAVILYKERQFTNLHHHEKQTKQKLANPSTPLTDIIKTVATHRPSAHLLLTADAYSGHHNHRDRHSLEIDMAHALQEQRIVLENGLTLLATIGSSAPFTGLFGTVWGIMHALQGLGGQDTISMDLVAGPVAEALVATAVGLFAAIPAVMGYNMLVRQLRRLLSTMEGNALHIIKRVTEATPPPQKEGV